MSPDAAGFDPAGLTTGAFFTDTVTEGAAAETAAAVDAVTVAEAGAATEAGAEAEAADAGADADADAATLCAGRIDRTKRKIPPQIPRSITSMTASTTGTFERGFSGCAMTTVPVDGAA